MIGAVFCLLMGLAQVQTESGPSAQTEPPAAPARDSRAIKSLLGAGQALELPPWGFLQHGQFPVGFESRSGLSIWYPAEPGPPMVLGDYASAAQLQSFGVDPAPLLGLSMYASREAEPVAGRFPLLVIPGGYLNVGMVAETAEYLASHGLVVVFFLVDDETVRGALRHATRMLRSISHPAADLERIALWGYQRGGMTATLLQGPAAARAVVSVEGSEAWSHPGYGYPAGRKLLQKLGRQSPVIRFQSNRQRPTWYFSSPTNLMTPWYDDYPAPFEAVEIDGVSHDQLNAFAVWSRLLPGLMKPSAGALQAHKTIAQRSLGFLREHLGD